MYATMYGMIRTTVYLPQDLKLALERVARVEGRSEAQLIREGVQQVVTRHSPQRPRIPLFESGDPTLAEHVDEHLDGFGER
jgi:Ribbon-helix-helix protein, copG family